MVVNKTPIRLTGSVTTW